MAQKFMRREPSNYLIPPPPPPAPPRPLTCSSSYEMRRGSHKWRLFSRYFIFYSFPVAGSTCKRVCARVRRMLISSLRAWKLFGCFSRREEEPPPPPPSPHVSANTHVFKVTSVNTMRPGLRPLTAQQTIRVGSSDFLSR